MFPFRNLSGRNSEEFFKLHLREFHLFTQGGDVFGSNGLFRLEKNITDLAAKLGLKPPYVTRVLGLNNLAPDIVEAIVNGAEPDGLSIAQIMKNIPEDWNEQRKSFGFPER